MPARDTFHDAVRNALTKDGWIITHDPYTLSYGTTNVYTDLGAERPIAAERDEEKIALEIKSFVGDSDIRELETAIGQFILYRMLMRRVEPDRLLLLAIPQGAFKSLFEMAAGERMINEIDLKLVVFDGQTEEIVRWLR